MKKVMSLIMCVLLLNLMFMCDSAQVQAVEQEVAEVHIITDEDFELLHITNEDYHIDTCLLVSQEDAVRLMNIAVVEDNTSAESQANIMLVVLNRVASPDYPDSIEGVILQKDSKGRYQFSTVANGKYFKAEPDVNSHLALAMVEGQQIKSDALSFEAKWAKNTWQSRNLVYINTVGGTKFYR